MEKWEFIEKYFQTNGCENCLGDLHRHCSEQCVNEFETRRNASIDIDQLILQTREETLREVLPEETHWDSSGNNPREEYELNTDYKGEGWNSAREEIKQKAKEIWGININ